MDWKEKFLSFGNTCGAERVTIVSVIALNAILQVLRPYQSMVRIHFVDREQPLKN